MGRSKRSSGCWIRLQPRDRPGNGPISKILVYNQFKAFYGFSGRRLRLAFGRIDVLGLRAAAVRYAGACGAIVSNPHPGTGNATTGNTIAGSAIAGGAITGSVRPAADPGSSKRSHRSGHGDR